MKKLLVVLLALTAVGIAAFADDAPVWTFGALWNTGAVITLGDKTSVPDATINLYDNNEPAVTRARFIGQVDLGGYGAKWYTAFNGDDPAKAVTFTNWWVYANLFSNMLQINVGAPDNGFSGTVNKGYGGTSPAGFQFVVMPIDGLKVGMAIPVNELISVTVLGVSVPVTDTLLKDTFKALQFGAFYTMPNMASVAFTYVMGKYDAAFSSVPSKTAELAAGVNVLAIPNLTAQFELDLTAMGDKAAGKDELFQNFAYVMGPLTPGLTLYEDLYAASGSKVKIQINPNVDYAVMTGTNVGLSLTYIVDNDGATGGNASGLNVDPYVKFTFNPKAAVKIDANYTIANLKSTSTWTMPININFLYSF